MNQNIASIEAIERQARAAAHQFTNVNDACPWSFYSPQGQAFKRAFTNERSAMLLQEVKQRREATQ